MRRILVIGGGIAGTAAALALDKAGFEVAVYEAHPDSGADIGAFLTLASNGMRALAQIDAAGVVADTGFPLTTLRVVDHTGAQLSAVPLGDCDNPLTRYRCLRRATLAAVLQAEARRRGIPTRHAARLDALAETSAGVTARFTDGSTAAGELAIGADGLNSTVRAVIDPAAPAPRYAGQRVFYGYTTSVAPAGEPEQITMIRGSAAAFGYAVSPAEQTYWFARVPGPPAPAGEIASATPARWRDELVPLLRRDATPAADIVAATHELMVTNAQDLAPGIRWRAGRMLVIGDAAHAASPATGQGASMALEDAVVLAKALRDAGTTDAALQEYQRLRRPRVERNIALSAQLTAGRTPALTDRAPGNDQPTQRPQQPISDPDEELMRQLDWHTPLVR